MKTKEELDAIKEEVKSLNKKLAALTDEEFREVVGGKEEMTNMPGGDDVWRTVIDAGFHDEQGPGGGK